MMGIGGNGWLGATVGREIQVAGIPTGKYLSIFLYVLIPKGDIRRVPVNQVLGVIFFVCNVSCVSSEREKPVLVI